MEHLFGGAVVGVSISARSAKGSNWDTSVDPRDELGELALAVSFHQVGHAEMKRSLESRDRAHYRRLASGQPHVQESGPDQAEQLGSSRHERKRRTASGRPWGRADLGTIKFAGSSLRRSPGPPSTVVS